MTAKEYFDKHGYAVLTNALTKQECEQLTEHMFNLHAQGKLVKDEQCPLSDAIYGDPIFEQLLNNFAEPLGKQVGKRLLPTYTYSRIYRPGDVLKRHIDRPSCEISATLTLGYKSKRIWPISFEDNTGVEVSADLDVGDLAVYKGTELDHWRLPFKGEWHVQVFLHYVDADGPFADFAGDRRLTEDLQHKNTQVKEESLNNQVEQQEYHEKAIEILNPIYNAVFIPNNKDIVFPGYFSINSDNLPELMFTKEECEKIISYKDDAYHSTATIGSNNEARISKEIRSANIFDLPPDPEYRWVFDKVVKAVSAVNTIYYDFDISTIIHNLQLIEYPSDTDVKGHYDWHIDAGSGPMATRKISFTAQLSDPNNYKGCDLIVANNTGQVQAVREQGSISLFPSYMPHVVTPVEEGVRYALVIWIHGARRFK